MLGPNNLPGINTYSRFWFNKVKCLIIVLSHVWQWLSSLMKVSWNLLYIWSVSNLYLSCCCLELVINCTSQFDNPSLIEENKLLGCESICTRNELFFNEIEISNADETLLWPLVPLLHIASLQTNIVIRVAQLKLVTLRLISKLTHHDCTNDKTTKVCNFHKA